MGVIIDYVNCGSLSDYISKQSTSGRCAHAHELDCQAGPALASTPPIQGLKHLPGCVAAGLSGVTTVKGLQAAMYRDMQGWGGAYKLLNATGRIGSQGEAYVMSTSM